MVGLTTQEAIAFGLAAAALIGFVIALALLTRGRRTTSGRERGGPDIPAAMRPGPSDADLEKPRLEKLQGWALASFLFLAIWIPLVWLREPDNNLDQEKAVLTESIERGERSVELYSEQNILGVGCVRCHGEGLGGGQNLYNGNIVPVPKLVDVCGGPNTGHALIHNGQDIINVIMQGRPGTDMPSWSIRFQGGLDDQQIQDIYQYIVHVNMDEVPFKQNVCINSEAEGYEEPVEPAS